MCARVCGGAHTRTTSRRHWKVSAADTGRVGVRWGAHFKPSWRRVFGCVQAGLAARTPGKGLVSVWPWAQHRGWGTELGDLQRLLSLRLCPHGAAGPAAWGADVVSWQGQCPHWRSLKPVLCGASPGGAALPLPGVRALLWLCPLGPFWGRCPWAAPLLTGTWDLPPLSLSPGWLLVQWLGAEFTRPAQTAAAEDGRAADAPVSASACGRPRAAV